MIIFLTSFGFLYTSINSDRRGGVVLPSSTNGDDDPCSFPDDLLEILSLTLFRRVDNVVEVDVGSGYFSRSLELVDDDETCGGGDGDKE